ncbi:uncharacterized protein LOC119772927 [Cyprinodon tularosa]|uniref:uncharacterized protein LOC119772927 n=1 Tax=Cyprinodon tularosa TaxID=77115 RepID=UPI0018E28622|nr:uncharacterized protein LOC119772927 [Cyprinodon tularosa]
MRLLASSLLLLCLSAYSEGTVISKEPGESIHLTCSSEECPTYSNEYHYLYLYYTIDEEAEVVFSNIKSERFSPRGKYESRTKLDIHNRTITLSNLTASDTGIYKCVYKKSSTEKITCSVYAVFITEKTPCSTVSPAVEPSPVLMYIIFVCIISVLAMWILMLLILPKVQQRFIKRRAMHAHQSSADNVYEIMRREEGAQVAAPIGLV